MTSTAAQHRGAILAKMKELDISISELARVADVDRSTLSKYLGGTGNPSCDWLDALHDALRRFRRRT